MSIISSMHRFLINIIQSRHLIFELAKKDFQSKYLGSYLGIIWAFIQPTIMILIFWFVFQVGFKATPMDNFPFILWLMTGMIPWFFFSDAINNATNAIMENSYLVKKVVFRVSILPIIKILSSLFIHLFFITFVFFMFLMYGYKPTLYNLQVFYYLTAIILLVLGFSWISSALVVFLRDIGQIIAMMLQFGFWLTPIFYTMKMIPEKYHILMKLNPMFYIIEGYRETFIYHRWFWEHKYLTIYFWSVTGLSLLLGIFIFKKLRPHFADVL